MLKYLCLLCVVLGAKAGIAPFIKPCKADDAPCILASARAALPFVVVGRQELGIKSLDPMYLDLVQDDQGGLSLTLKNSTVNGMKQCVIEALKRDLHKGKLTLTTRCPADLAGDYSLHGNVLLLPIKGKGKYKIHIRDIVIKTTAWLVTVDGADGKKHWHIDKWHFTSDVKTSARFDFDNLFEGNKNLAETVSSFLNLNWRDVMQEVAPPIIRAIVSSVVDAVEALYKAVPAEELEL